MSIAGPHSESESASTGGDEMRRCSGVYSKFKTRCGSLHGRNALPTRRRMVQEDSAGELRTKDSPKQAFQGIRGYRDM